MQFKQKTTPPELLQISPKHLFITYKLRFFINFMLKIDSFLRIYGSLRYNLNNYHFLSVYFCTIGLQTPIYKIIWIFWWKNARIIDSV